MTERRGDTGIEGPTDLPKRAWRAAFRRTVRKFLDDDLFDWAAALTYYSVLSIFPAIVGLLVALWAASAYIGGFIRAANAIYEMAEGRPVWKTLPLRIALTLVTVTLLSACAFGVVVTGAIASGSAGCSASAPPAC